MVLEKPLANESRWPISHLISAIGLMVFLIILFLVIGSQFVSSDSVVVDIGTFIIELIGILYLNSKYPMSFFPVEDFKRVLIYGFGWSLLPLSIFIYQIINQIFKTPADYERFQLLGYIGKSWFFLANTILPAFFEETLFRGYFYRILRNRLDIFWGLAISTFLFAAIHGFPGYIIMQSLLYTYVYEKTGSIWGSSLTHFMNNFVWFYLAYSIVR